LLLVGLASCSPATTNAPRSEPCANPVLQVQNNAPYRADIWQWQNFRDVWIGSVAALSKTALPVDGKPGHYFARTTDGKSITTRDAVRIDRACPN
jgi:hypothetical protein